MATTMRKSTLETLGLGTVVDMVENGRRPASAGDLVDRVFGDSGSRGALVISGANGIVGAGKTMQLGTRLLPFGVPIVALDFPNAPDGIGQKYQGLVAAFGREGADKVMESITRLSYDGKNLPEQLKDYKPRFLLEAIPEMLEVKRAHYDVFRKAYPEIEIRSVTSGFPSKELGVGIAHPAFPHEINKMWEVVEPEPSAITQLLWALGMIPVPVSDDWSFVLDVLFCGVTLAADRYHLETNMPFWKVDKYVRRLLGPNPFRAHDAIGAKGATFLTWSCLHHLSGTYGELFTPTADFDVRKVSGQTWYPPNHFRPLVNWSMTEDEENLFNVWMLGPMLQMTSLLVHENRAEPAHINIIGEICAQFRSGMMAVARSYGADKARSIVGAYHELHPAAARKAWYPDAFDRIGDPDWQQLYVNAEHNGRFGVITLGRESYNADVDAELNRAIDWLKKEGIDRVVVTGDFHLSTQMVGADTSDFYPALEDESLGLDISQTWSKTARRLNDEFAVSVGFVDGKRALGGMLELLMHCHYLVADQGARLGMPEVTLPVVPGMEGCHWPFRKTDSKNWPKVMQMLLTGKQVKAPDAVGWLIDYAGPVDDALQTVAKLLTDGDHGLKMRPLETGALSGLPADGAGFAAADDPAGEAAKGAILATITDSCGKKLSEALEVQARHSAGFMSSKWCRKGMIGATYAKTMKV
ncbi:MAG: enoyl-CoA hydratase-related protein [Candidatus Latescibacterota bacterium]|jgi:enoyl-CoA hydratase/carnithine racemase